MEPPHILIVDESPVCRKILERILTREGYWVSLAEDGWTGLAMVRMTLHPLIVLLAEMAPGLRGWDLLQVVDRNTQLAQLHTFVFMPSGRNDAYQKQLAALHLVRPLVLEKPFSEALIQGVVAQSVGVPGANERPYIMGATRNCSEGYASEGYA